MPALHEIENAFQRAAFLPRNGPDHLPGLGPPQSPMAPEGFAIRIGRHFLRHGHVMA